MKQKKRRKSKLDPFLDKVGILPDRQVSEMAGVTPENVRAFRKRRGIPARWRGEGGPLPDEAKLLAELGLRPSPHLVASFYAPVSQPDRAPEHPPAKQYRIEQGFTVIVETNTGDTGTMKFVVVGSDISQAAQRAVAGAEARGYGKILEIRYMADALI